MPNGVYSSAFSYHVKFQGSYPPFQTGKLWRAKTKAKVKNFGWMPMHQKIPMTETLAARGMEPNQTCSLYNDNDEDT
jgi:hypothetical protein